MSLIISFLAIIPFIVQNNTQILIKKLNSDTFSVREKAQKELSQKMDFQLLIKLREVKKSPEVKRRINKLIEGYCDTLRPQYRTDLKGYKAFPFIGAGMPKNYRLNGYWEGWEKPRFVAVYLSAANLSGALEDGFPNWTNYRKATQLWMEARERYNLKKAIEECDDEDDFKDIMKRNMEVIQKDIEMFIEGDREYFKRVEWKNPCERDSYSMKKP